MFSFFFFPCQPFLWFTLQGWFPNHQTYPCQARVKLKRLSTAYDERTFRSTKKKKSIPIQAKCELMGSLTIAENLNKQKNANMNWKMPTHSSLIRGFCLIFLLYCQEMKYLFLLEFFFSYLSAPQPQIVTQGSDELRERVVVTSNICTCSSEGNEVCIF